jgi:hypothetical protein
MSYRRLVFLALLAGLPTMTWAQFTTFIPPQKKLADSMQTVAVAQERARADSVMRIKLTDMKAWVDSAAGTVAMPTTAADPTATPNPIPTTPARDTAAFTPAAADSALRLRHGAKAPNTASDLPMLALIGAIALAIGTVMLAGNQLGRERA